MPQICFSSELMYVFALIIITICGLSYLWLKDIKKTLSGVLPRLVDPVAATATDTWTDTTSVVVPNVPYPPGDAVDDRYVPPHVVPTNSRFPFRIPSPLSLALHVNPKGPVQQYGVLIDPNDSKIILPLFARNIENGNKFEYYTTSHYNNSVKLPIKRTKELYTNDTVDVVGYNNKLRVQLYDSTWD